MARTVLRGRDGGNAVLLPDYLRDYTSPRDTRTGLGQYLLHYNEQRPHSALDYRTPAAVYFGKEHLTSAA
jgi:transposase InsO family protein